MKQLLLSLIFFGSVGAMAQTTFEEDSTMIRNIYSEVLAHGECHENLRVLCKDIGARLSGSAEADQAIAWGKALLENYGFQNVHLQEVEVPHWVRGEGEYGYFESAGERHPTNICALGGSVGCSGVITAEVVEVKTFEELEALGRERIEGKIVLFNRPMDPLLINTGAAYGGAYNQRGQGASEASRYGAAAVLVRSLTHALDTFPHTGGMHYDDDVERIPAAAISTVHASELSEALKRDPKLRYTLYLGCQRFEDKMQANVIGELPGSVYPEEYIVVGGHLDSWDIGEGAHDDGAGIVQSIEVLRALQALDVPLKRTLRVVLYINEENGNNGGETYARVARETGMNHYAAIESDAGGFTPRGFRLQGNDEQYEVMKTWQPLFEPYNVHLFKRGFSGVDIGPLKNDTTALFGLVPDGQRYFDYHHSNRDTFENVNKRELELGAATIASLVYLVDRRGW
ncbi:MAG: M28 family peptidase [Flavobacteriales bacterium]|nr:M28 family peptidase [Flavobacteriales bacterium]